MFQIHRDKFPNTVRAQKLTTNILNSVIVRSNGVNVSLSYNTRDTVTATASDNPGVFTDISSTEAKEFYARIGKRVMVWGSRQFTINGADSAVGTVYLDLPINPGASFTAVGDLVGVVSTTLATDSANTHFNGILSAKTGSKLALMSVQCGEDINESPMVHYSYSYNVENNRS